MLVRFCTESLFAMSRKLASGILVTQLEADFQYALRVMANSETSGEISEGLGYSYLFIHAEVTKSKSCTA